MVNRSYDGPALDGTVQYITDGDELDAAAEDVVYATPPEPPGEERTEGEPVIKADGGDRSAPPDVDGQSTLDDWGGGSA